MINHKPKKVSFRTDKALSYENLVDLTEDLWKIQTLSRDSCRDLLQFAEHGNFIVRPCHENKYPVLSICLPINTRAPINRYYDEKARYRSQSNIVVHYLIKGHGNLHIILNSRTGFIKTHHFSDLNTLIKYYLFNNFDVNSDEGPLLKLPSILREINDPIALKAFITKYKHNAIMFWRDFYSTRIDYYPTSHIIYIASPKDVMVNSSSQAVYSPILREDNTRKTIVPPVKVRQEKEVSDGKSYHECYSENMEHSNDCLIKELERDLKELDSISLLNKNILQTVQNETTRQTERFEKDQLPIPKPRRKLGSFSLNVYFPLNDPDQMPEDIPYAGESSCVDMNENSIATQSPVSTHEGPYDIEEEDFMPQEQVESISTSIPNSPKIRPNADLAADTESQIRNELNSMIEKLNKDKNILVSRNHQIILSRIEDVRKREEIHYKDLRKIAFTIVERPLGVSIQAQKELNGYFDELFQRNHDHVQSISFKEFTYDAISTKGPPEELVSYTKTIIAMFQRCLDFDQRCDHLRNFYWEIMKNLRYASHICLNQLASSMDKKFLWAKENAILWIMVNSGILFNPNQTYKNEHVSFIVDLEVIQSLLEVKLDKDLEFIPYLIDCIKPLRDEHLCSQTFEA